MTHLVAMMDVDRMQIHFATYFRWMDASYSNLLVELGHPLEQLFDDKFATPVVDARCRYLSPVGLGDRVEVDSGVQSAGRTSFVIRHRFRCRAIDVAEGFTTHVWVRQEAVQRSEAVPDWIREAVIGP